MRGVLFPISLLLLPSCLPTEQVTLPPDLGPMQAVLLVVAPWSSASEPIAYGFENLESVQLPLSISRDVDIDAYVLPYACDLMSLGWQPGRIDVLSESNEGARALPAPLKIFHGGFDGENPLPWTELDVAPEVLLALRLKSSASPCSTFESHEFRIPRTREFGISLALALDAERVLLSPKTAGGPIELIEATRTSTSRVFVTDENLPNNAAYPLPDGRLLLLGLSGLTAIGTIEDGFSVIQSRASGGRLRAWLAGSRPGEPTEVFAVTDSGTFDRFDGRTWQSIRNFTGSVPFGGVVRLGEMEALALGPDQTGILRWNAGEETIEQFSEIPTSSQAVSLVELPGLGAIFATVDGQLFRRTDKWRFYVRTQDRSSIALMVRFRDSLILNEASPGPGVIRQFFPPSFFCEAQAVTSAVIGLLTEAPNGFVAVSRPLNQDASIVLILERESGSPCFRRTILDYKANR
jgi:hypothetical protein